MNVTDQWMLERMQQMAANMAASLPQTSQNADPSKTEKGESFQDLMNKAKDQQVEGAPKKDAPKKTETVQDKAPAQKTEQSQQSQSVKDTSKVNLDANTAALVAAGYAQILEIYEDGSALIMLDPEKSGGGFAIVSSGLPTADQELVPVTITNAMGQKVTVTPEQIQEVFARYGVKEFQKDSSGATLVGQLDLSKHQDMKVLTPDGKFTTLKEAMQQVRVKDNAAGGEENEADLGAEAADIGQPLFKDVEAPPVKVGENFQLDTQQPEMDDHLADAIRFAAQQGLRQMEIKLSPENLGNLTIKLTQAADGTLQVVLHAANLKAANLLNQHLDNLNAALQGYSQNEVRVEVQRNEDSQQSQQQQQQTDPNGHNQQRQQEQRQQEQEHSGDFVQRLRLGLFGQDDNF